VKAKNLEKRDFFFFAIVDFPPEGRQADERQHLLETPPEHKLAS